MTAFHTIALSVLYTAALVITTASASPTPAPTPNADGSIDGEFVLKNEAFEEILELKPDKNETDTEGIYDAVDEIVPTYNELMKILNDPLKRQLSSVAIIQIDVVELDQRKRNLRSSDDRKLMSSKKYLRVLFLAIGTCYKCKKDDKLMDDISNNRRRLSTSHIPTIDSIVTAQNKRIRDSDNDTVNEVSELRASAVRLAAEANIAAANAEVHEEYVKALEEEFKKQKAKVTQDHDRVGRWWRSSYYSIRFSNIRTSFQNFIGRINRKLTDIAEKLALAKAEQIKLDQKAAELKQKATAAELLALEAEEEAILPAQSDAQSKNAASAIRVTSNLEFIDATFDDSLDGFSYHDDMFHGTNQPYYATGRHTTSGGGALIVELGGKDYDYVGRISGGWSRTFTLKKEATNVQIFFEYELEMSQYFEAHESANLLAKFDGTMLESTYGTGVIATLRGTFHQTTTPSTGIKAFAQDIGNLEAGSHTIELGAFLNQKTYINEYATATFRSVMVVVDYSTDAAVVDTDFSDRADGFSLDTSIFGRPHRMYTKSGQNSDGSLFIRIGGFDNYEVLSMSAGWVSNFFVPKDGSYEISVRYKMDLSYDFEHGEDGHALVKVDDSQHRMGIINGTNVPEKTTGWRTFTTDLGVMSKGDHQVAVGGLLTKKTWFDEVMTISFSSVRIAPS